MILGLMLLVVSGCGRSSPTEIDSSKQLLDSFGSLLERRSESLSTNNRDGFLEPMTDAARRTEEPIGNGFLALEADSPWFEVTKKRSNRIRQSYLVETTFTYRYPGLSEENTFGIPIG